MMKRVIKADLEEVPNFVAHRTSQKTAGKEVHFFIAENQEIICCTVVVQGKKERSYDRQSLLAE